MKILISLAVFAEILAIAPCVHGANLTGTWKGAFDYQGESVPLTFHLTVTGGAVTGTIEGLPTTPTDIHEGKIDGDKVSFWANTDYQGQTYKLVFTGQVSSAADGISFTLGTDDGSWSSALRARKSTEPIPAPADVTGTWKGSFDFQGMTAPVTLNLTSAGEAVTGTVAGMVDGAPDKPVEIQEGKLDGDTLTFWLNTQYQGDTYKIVYNGKLVDGKIKFTFGTDDGSWTNEMTVEKAGNQGTGVRD